LTSLTGADAIFTTDPSPIGSFNTIGFRTANLATGITPDRVLIDNLSIGLVPEPNTTLLLGLALLGLAAASRRRS
jgi:hypothetical protein